MNLGEVYKKLRFTVKTDSGETISIKEFAEKIGLAAPRISELENNKREMSLTELKAYHKFFDVSFEYLLGETDIASVDEYIQTACKVTGLSEKAIATIHFTVNPPYEEMPSDLIKESENEFEKIVSETCEELTFDEIKRMFLDTCEHYSFETKKICFQFFETDLFSKVLQNLTIAARSLINNKRELAAEMSDPTITSFLKIDPVVKMAFETKQQRTMNTEYKVPLLEIYEDLSQFIRTYVDERMSEEASDNAEHNPPTE